MTRPSSSDVRLSSKGSRGSRRRSTYMPKFLAGFKSLSSRSLMSNGSSQSNSKKATESAKDTPTKDTMDGSSNSSSNRRGRPSLNKLFPNFSQKNLMSNNSKSLRNMMTSKSAEMVMDNTTTTPAGTPGSTDNANEAPPTSINRPRLRPFATSVRSSITMNESFGNIFDLEAFDDLPPTAEEDEGEEDEEPYLVAAGATMMPLLDRGVSMDSDSKPLRPLRRTSEATIDYNLLSHTNHHSNNSHSHTTMSRRTSRTPFSLSVTSNCTNHSSITMLDFDDIQEDRPLAQPKMERGIMTEDSDHKPLRPFRRRSSSTNSHLSAWHLDSQPQRPSRPFSLSVNSSSNETNNSSLTMVDFDYQEHYHGHGQEQAPTTQLVREKSLDCDCKPLRPLRRDSRDSGDHFNNHDNHRRNQYATHERRHSRHHPRVKADKEEMVIVPMISSLRRLETINSADSRPLMPGRQESVDLDGESATSSFACASATSSTWTNIDSQPLVPGRQSNIDLPTEDEIKDNDETEEEDLRRVSIDCSPQMPDRRISETSHSFTSLAAREGVVNVLQQVMDGLESINGISATDTITGDHDHDDGPNSNDSHSDCGCDEKKQSPPPQAQQCKDLQLQTQGGENPWTKPIDDRARIHLACRGA